MEKEILDNFERKPNQIKEHDVWSQTTTTKIEREILLVWFEIIHDDDVKATKKKNEEWWVFSFIEKEVYVQELLYSHIYIYFENNMAILKETIYIIYLFFQFEFK